ncbi:MAG: peptidoglycan editing factor PgeF [bacterium]|nr:peptidoglycan editing factor PgeF [bacterium]
MTDFLPLIQADWPAPANIHAVVTTRSGGVSVSPWDSLNLGAHVGDDPVHVAENRQLLQAALRKTDCCETPQWLNQVHGTVVVEAEPDAGKRALLAPDADAVGTDKSGIPCVVMTADCLPVFFCDRKGSRVAVAHAGWRGLCDGVLEATLKTFADPADVLAWLGPAIGPEKFEVGEEVRAAFVAKDAAAVAAFVPGTRAGHWLADIYALARLRLQEAGVGSVYGGGFCTVTDSERFFSYRRDGRTGRMASVIWINP